MNKALSAVVVTLFLTSGNAVAANSCATILCLGGSMLGGNGGAMCAGPIQDYFDIKKYRKGKFNPSRTSQARQSFLGTCQEGSAADKSRIQDKYGTVPNNPKKF